MPTEFDKKDIEDNKNFAILSYLSFLFIIPMFYKKYSNFANFHAKQGKNLFLFQVIVVILKIVNEFLLVKVLPIEVYVAIGMVISLLILSVLSFSVMGIINVVAGEAKKLPLIGGF